MEWGHKMKTFLMFLAIFIISMSFVVYQGDIDQYTRLQTFLKATAEEAACVAALYYDEEAFSRGFMVINGAEGEKYLAELILQTEDKLSLRGDFDISGSMEIGDKDVVVTLELNCDNLFRLPFLRKNKVVRSAKYELVHY